MIDRLFKKCRPYYLASQDVSPIEHIEIVMGFAKEIAEGENLNQEQSMILLLSAMFHDIGICMTKTRKVVESEVAKHEGWRKEALIAMACESRMEHMIYGADITRMILSYDQEEHRELFQGDINEICRLVKNHDNVKIARYNKRAYLLNDKEDWLLQLLNEADALWMLTPEGIKKDIERGSGFTPKEQMAWNIRNHKNVYLLYKELTDIEGYNFIEETMYRSKTGYSIFKRLTKGTA